MKVGTSKFVSTTVDGHPAIPDSVAVQSLQNNASVQSFHDGDIKGTSTKDSALKYKTCVVLLNKRTFRDSKVSIISKKIIQCIHKTQKLVFKFELNE